MSTASGLPQSSATPILDRLVPVPTPRTSQSRNRGSRTGLLIVSGLLVLIIAWISAMFWSSAISEVSSLVLAPVARFLDHVEEQLISDRADLLRLAFSWVAAPFLAVIVTLVVHEFGHLIAGLAVGLKFVAIRLGPVQINRPFRISLELTGGRASGAISMVPRHETGARWRYLVMILAGPAANLLSVLGILLLVGHTSVFTNWFLLVSTVIGVCNLVPFKNPSLVSDGKRILMLLRGGGQGERWIAIAQLAADLLNGVLPEDLDPGLLAMATAVRDDSIDTIAGHLFAFSSVWYTGTADEAARLLEVCLQYSGSARPLLREAAFSDAGVFQGRKRRRQDLAREWLAELPEKTQYPGLRQRVEAAMLEAEGDFGGSLKKLEEVESALQTLPNRQQRMISLRSVQRWRSELTEKLHVPTQTAKSS
jgi:hypothetical protein